jgi:hypothetical protein
VFAQHRQRHAGCMTQPAIPVRLFCVVALNLEMRAQRVELTLNGPKLPVNARRGQLIPQLRRRYLSEAGDTP